MSVLNFPKIFHAIAVISLSLMVYAKVVLQIIVQDLMTIQLCVPIVNTVLIIKSHYLMKSRITNQSYRIVKLDPQL